MDNDSLKIGEAKRSNLKELVNMVNERPSKVLVVLYHDFSAHHSVQLAVFKQINLVILLIH